MAETPKLYNTANVLQSPAEEFTQSEPMNAPESPSAALALQKRLRQAGIDSTKTAYVWGKQHAREMLGLTKAAVNLNPLRQGLERLLIGPYGEMAVRVPVQSSMGALAGAASGQLYGDRPSQGAILGALSGGLGGMAVASAPKLRGKLLRVLRNTV